MKYCFSYSRPASRPSYFHSPFLPTTWDAFWVCVTFWFSRPIAWMKNCYFCNWAVILCRSAYLGQNHGTPAWHARGKWGSDGWVRFLHRMFSTSWMLWVSSASLPMWSFSCCCQEFHTPSKRRISPRGCVILLCSDSSFCDFKPSKNIS